MEKIRPYDELDPFSQWMVRSNLQYIQQEGLETVVNRLKSNGYHSVAAAVEKIGKRQCHRRNCGKSPALWFNKSTREYYCDSCSHVLNIENREDAMRLYGTDLCILSP